VIDGGSTDGTIEYLKNRGDITPVFQGKLIGAARACNEVWKNVECKYTAPFADDEECLPGAFDFAINILEKNPDIGMVGLKIKDLAGPKKHQSFNGGVFSPGILCMSQPVCKMDVLKAVGFIDERFISYRADADLTASFLCAGKKVVMTKNLTVLHHREWAEDLKKLEEAKNRSNVKESKKALYHKFKFLEQSKNTISYRLKKRVGSFINKTLNLQKRDLEVIGQLVFMKIYDPIITINKPYHFIQKVPEKFLKHQENPYRHLVDTL
jgi:GT2 family glycosyltransferase